MYKTRTYTGKDIETNEQHKRALISKHKWIRQMPRPTENRAKELISTSPDAYFDLVYYCYVLEAALAAGDFWTADNQMDKLMWYIVRYNDMSSYLMIRGILDEHLGEGDELHT